VAGILRRDKQAGETVKSCAMVITDANEFASVYPGEWLPHADKFLAILSGMLASSRKSGLLGRGADVCARTVLVGIARTPSTVKRVMQFIVSPIAAGSRQRSPAPLRRLMDSLS
jgi:hypothetical protein